MRFLCSIALQYVNENAQQMYNSDETSKGVIRQLMREGEIALDEISRIIVDLFIAAADTVRALSMVKPVT